MDTEGDQQDSARDSKGTTPARITATERRRQKEAEAARLRAQGQSYSDIAQALGYRDPSSAHKAVARALVTSYREPTDAARLLAQNRLDALRQRLVGIITDTPLIATRDEIAAIRVLLDIEKREAALLGLDITAAPVVTSGHLDAEIERLTREIGALDNLPVPDPWERPDWTPQDQHPDEDDGPRGEVVPFDRRGDHRNGQHPTRQGTNGRGRGD